jgi:cell division protein FtsI/penicillin-binding protein 2
MKYKKNGLIVISVMILSAVLFKGYESYALNAQTDFNKRLVSAVKNKISKSLISEKKLTDEVKFEDTNYKLDYTINDKLQLILIKLLKRYPSEHTSVVIVDNKTGGILAAAGVKKENREIDFTLPFSSTHPSASLFKLVTSADLIENGGLFPEKMYTYRGKGTTLYKFQLKDKKSRWTKRMSFQKAFIFSNNVIFGKAAIRETDATSIFKMAQKFGFNRNLMDDFNLGISRFDMPDSQYNLAELASGFNKETQVSPVHAALFSLIIANDGVLMKPHILKSITSEEDELISSVKTINVFSKKTAKDLRVMMEATTDRGTARRLTRGRIGRKIAKFFDLGAKTGSITGGMPYGKRDWITLYAKPKLSGGSGISISVMNINKKKWYYKSTFIAKNILNEFRKLHEVEVSESAITKKKIISL